MELISHEDAKKLAQEEYDKEYSSVMKKIDQIKRENHIMEVELENNYRKINDSLVEKALSLLDLGV